MSTTGYEEIDNLVIDVSQEINPLKDNNNNIIYVGLKNSQSGSCDNNFDVKKMTLKKFRNRFSV